MPYVRPILTDTHPTLRKRAKRVDPREIQTALFQQLIDDMFETMYAAPGIGLAAPQIGESIRLFVVDLQDDPQHGPFVVINPKFTLLEGAIDSTEGCLSVPGYIGEVTRYERVTCVGLGRHGERVSLVGEELFGRCLQHEVDHLDGVLYIDKVRNLRSAETPVEVEEADHALDEAVAAVVAS